MSETFKILRFRFDKPTTIVKRGLTLEEAQDWCNREDTHGEGWFDGYTGEFPNEIEIEEEEVA